MNVLAFAASNAQPSINQQLALWAARQIPNAEVQTLDLNDYELPIYSGPREQQLGTPKQVTEFLAHMQKADVIIIGFAEHNGTFTAAWKNLMDWVSRTERAFLYQKPTLILATSPGSGGAQSVLEHAANSLPYFGGQILGAISVAKFGEIFDTELQTLKPGPAKEEILRTLAMLGTEQTQ